MLDGAGEFLARALLVGVVEAQHETAAGLAREEEIDDGSAGIAEMQPPGRARREADRGHVTEGAGARGVSPGSCTGVGPLSWKALVTG